MSFNDDMKNIDFEGTDLEGLIMNNPLEKGLKALEEAGDLREKVSRLEKALANCASALYESNINHKKAIDKIQAECIDVLFDFAAKRDDSGFTLSLHDQPCDIQDAIRTFHSVAKGD